MPKSEVVYLPCRDCGLPLPVNTVYLPYLNGKSSCVPHRCQKNDRNVWSLLLNENDSQYPHRGHLIHCPARFARSVHSVLYWFNRTSTRKRSERSERSGTNTYQHVQNICPLVLRTRYPVTRWLVSVSLVYTRNTGTKPLVNGVIPCHTMYMVEGGTTPTTHQVTVDRLTHTH